MVLNGVLLDLLSQQITENANAENPEVETLIRSI
jgi:hypothetical protein